MEPYLRVPRRTKPLRVEYRAVRLAGSCVLGLIFALMFALAVYRSRSPGLALPVFALGSIGFTCLFTWSWRRGRRVSGEERRRGYRDSTGKR